MGHSGGQTTCDVDIKMEKIHHPRCAPLLSQASSGPPADAASSTAGQAAVWRPARRALTHMRLLSLISVAQICMPAVDNQIRQLAAQQRLSRPRHVPVKAGADAATGLHVALSGVKRICAILHEMNLARCVLDLSSPFGHQYIHLHLKIHLQNPELVCWLGPRAGLQFGSRQAASQLAVPLKGSSSGPAGFASPCMRASPVVLALPETLHPAGN